MDGLVRSFSYWNIFLGYFLLFFCCGGGVGDFFVFIRGRMRLARLSAREHLGSPVRFK